eukprot:12071198-Karenia_brevis.AAC.1
MRDVKAKWRSKGWGINLGSGNSNLLQNLRFADDILLLAPSLYQARCMLLDLKHRAADAGLAIHMGKTNIL